MLVAFVLAILTLNSIPRVDSPDYRMWVVLLGMQCIPYAATLLTSLISVSPISSRWIGQIIEKNRDLTVQPKKG